VAQLTGIRVLVVDDSEDTRELFAFALGLHGATVAGAGSAAEALAALEQSLPSVIVCDIGLPDLDGCTLMRTVRAWPPERGGRLPAVALTGYSNDEMRDRIYAAGYQEHLVKPVDPDRMAEIIARAVRRDAGDQT
jgi:CheY-like chemotaxis protein